VFLLSGAVIIEGPSNVILIPPETVAVFSCNITEGVLPAWVIDGDRLFPGIDQFPPGHVLDGSNLNVTMGVNGTEYRCFITLNNFPVDSDPAFLFIASKLMHTEIQNLYKYAYTSNLKYV